MNIVHKLTALEEASLKRAQVIDQQHRATSPVVPPDLKNTFAQVGSDMEANEMAEVINELLNIRRDELSEAVVKALQRKLNDIAWERA